jgi:hypothetical protein
MTLTQASAIPRRKRYVAALDADLCVFNENVHDLLRKKHPYSATLLISKNLDLLEHLRERMGQASEYELLDASIRQSYKSDRGNADRNGTPLFVHAIQDLHAKLTEKFPQLKLNKYLLADTHGKIPHGASFILAERKDAAKHNLHKDWIYDESKLTLLYAQMWKIASEHPSDDICFDLYDDKEEILQNLKSFFSKNPELMPPNLTLNLYQYTGDNRPKPITENLKGNEHSVIDYNWEENIYRMWGLDPRAEKFQRPADTSAFTYLSRGNNLANFKQNRKTDKETVSNTRLELKLSFAHDPEVYAATLVPLCALVDEILINENGNAAYAVQEILEQCAAKIRADASFASEKILKLIDHLSSCLKIMTGRDFDKLLTFIQGNTVFHSNPTSSSLDPLLNPHLERLKNEVLCKDLERDLIALERNPKKGNSLIHAAGKQVLAAVKTAKKEPLSDTDIRTLNTVLRYTSEAVTARTTEPFKKLASYVEACKEIPKQRTWGRIVFGAALVLLGAVIITTSVMVAVESFGIATPLSVLGFKIGMGLMTTGIAAACSAAGVASVVGGVALWRHKTNPIIKPVEHAIAMHAPLPGKSRPEHRPVSE